MKTSVIVGLTATSFATVSMASDLGTTFKSPLLGDLKVKRDYLTCDQTYGGGSITCGSVDSHFCFDPTLGETCCLLDYGYCKAGDFCAPVAGFCCHDGESPATCAARLSFTLPSSAALSNIIASSASATATSTLASTTTIQTTSALTTTLTLSQNTVTQTHTGMFPDYTAKVGSADGGNGTVPAKGTGVVNGGLSGSGGSTATPDQVAVNAAGKEGLGVVGWMVVVGGVLGGLLL